MFSRESTHTSDVFVPETLHILLPELRPYPSWQFVVTFLPLYHPTGRRLNHRKAGAHLMAVSAANYRQSGVIRKFNAVIPILRNLVLSSGLLVAVALAAAQTPALGAQAPNFTLLTPTGTTVSLAGETARGTTVLVVLRGFPGYQCPYCVRQVHDFVDHNADFAAKGVDVLIVYPGPSAGLGQHANEFLAQQSQLPANIQLVVDPDYKMTDLYGLRWDAPHETAYPSTFILDRQRTILFEKISHTHGDRTTAQEILARLGAM
jgi:peroxiredoxin